MAFSAASSLILAFCILNGFAFALGSEYVPAYMWGATAKGVRKSGALSKLSADEFQRILTEQLESKPFAVVFIEENLSMEDISSRTDAGGSTFPGLKARNADGSGRLYPSVEPFLSALDRVADPDRVDRVKFTADGLSAEIQPLDGDFLYVSMEDAREDESRSDMLSRHDAFMAQLYEKLVAKHGRVLALYTAKHSSWTAPEPAFPEDDEVSVVRMRRNLLQATDLEEAVFYNASSLVMLYLTKITLKQADSKQEIELKGAAAATGQHPTKDEVIMNIPFPQHNVTFYFLDKSGYWFLDRVTVAEGAQEEEILTNSRVYAEAGFSYHCSNQISLSGGNNTLTLHDFQLQAFFDDSVPRRFSDAFDCVGFTSIPIWSGLFVVAILLIIMFTGIAMMMDIRTMDRFDDPKGKTITINAGE